MSFNPKYIGDISNFPCDVIINSLGVNTIEYGGICKSIIKASNDKEELENIFKRANDIYDVGEYFFTESFGLPVKSICHLITPHRDSDDKNLNIFIYSVRNVLVSCMDLGFKNIGIPLIGTGANKYDDKIIYDLLCKICESFCSFFKVMNITIVLPKTDIASENNYRLLRELNSRGFDYHTTDTIKKFQKSTKLFINYYQYSDETITFDRAFFLKSPTTFKTKSKMNLKGVDKIPSYINEFVDAKFDGNSHKKVKKNIHAYLGYGKNDPLVAGANTFNKMKNVAEKETLFKICLAARMEPQEALDFLSYFGYCFSKEGVNAEDDLMSELLTKHIYGIIEVNKAFKEKLNRPLFK